MSLLRELQISLLQPGQDLGPILLKLRFLASRLGSGALEEWVKYETEGYPGNIEVPDYRKVGVSYTANFSGPFGSGIRNAPIPPYLIEQHAGKHWTTYEIRQSVSGIDSLLAGAKESGSLHIEASDLILLLQGKVYQDYACNSVDGTISKSSLVELLNAVRTRILELTIQLEKSIPASAEITLGPLAASPGANEREAVTRIAHQVIYGNVTTISNSGEGAQFNLSIGNRDSNAFIKALIDHGIAETDARELANLVASEEAESAQEPFGVKAKAWIERNIKKAIDGTWKVGIAVATKLLTEAAMRYYGFK